jgi:hypothetical protein
VINGIDYRRDGLTLDRMGITGMQAEDLLAYALSGLAGRS